MERRILLLGVTLVLVIIQMIDTATAKGDPRDCEVCIKVLEKFEEVLQGDERNNADKLEVKFTKFCKDLKGKEHKFCYYLGAVDNAPTRIVRQLTAPISSFMPAKKVCEKLKKSDAEICALRYEKQIDLASTNLKKLRVNELKKILSVWGEENACKGCMEKSDYIKEIERLMPKYDPEAHKKRVAAKSEL
ncbi:hypothetical protein ACOMHN_016419 [Nucella lapillus]